MRPGTAIGPIVHERLEAEIGGCRWTERGRAISGLAGRIRGARRFAVGADAQLPAIGRDRDAAVAVGAQHAGASPLQAGNGVWARVSVGVLRSDRDDRQRRPDRGQERRRRRGSAPVVRDLQHVGVAKASPQQDRVDLLLGIAHEQEAPLADRQLENDRNVVDRLAALWRRTGHAARVRPENPEPPVVDGEPVAGPQPPGMGAALGEYPGQRHVARTGARHPRLHEATDPVPRQEPEEPRRVVLVRMGQYHQVDPSVPGRQPPVEQRDKSVRIGATVDQYAAAR